MVLSVLSASFSLHQAAQLAGIDLVLAEEHAAVAGYRDHNGVVLVGIRHGGGVVHLGHVDLHLVLQHGSDDHENDQQHQHHVHHGGDVDVGIYFLAFVTNCNSHFGAPCVEICSGSVPASINHCARSSNRGAVEGQSPAPPEILA